ncbi:rho GTPase-activating protein 20-like isoform X1 [Lethenteron reissneri]|uniref:rho GTPase-activating protein 20-like isoform X1 n=1 Tax=Lethenteron reissneri TaxID=7753 RepID=UPI002AB768F8|nr:rho GTPase-activating protein 20-like isoform X1 [Lethenteron reissneri]
MEVLVPLDMHTLSRSTHGHKITSKTRKMLLQRRKSAPALNDKRCAGFSDGVLSPSSPLQLGPWRLGEAGTTASPSSPLPNSVKPRWTDLLAPVQPGVDGVQLVSHVTLHVGLQSQERCLILFPSTLIVAKYKSGGVKPKTAVRLCEMWTASCLGDVCEATVPPLCSFVMGWPTTNHVVTFRSEEDRDVWFAELTRRIEAEKAKEEPKSIPLKILVQDIPTPAFAKTLCVGNTDTAQEVIAMALKQFSITGQSSDFKLWVYSGKDGTPYPLIGHEQPYSVRMRHVRDAVQCLGSDVRVGGSSFPVDARFPDESLPPDLRCHFVLRATQRRPSQPPPAATYVRDEPVDSSGGKLRRKRSLMSWTLRRSSSRSDSDAPLSPLSPAAPSAGGVFGVPLSLLCPDGAPPRSIMALLSAIFREGPFTRGIFRKSANMRHCRTLRERLASGEHVDWTQETPHVAAAVFTDFLRNVPGSLLCSELYHGWLDGISEEHPQERLQSVRRLLRRVPPCHHLLLRALLCVLHHVAALARHNHMTAANLARCVAPSLLWPSRGGEQQQQRSDTLQVVELVEFLICHCQELFGEDVTTIFGPLPEPSQTDTDNSDSSDASSSLRQRDSLCDGAPAGLHDDGRGDDDSQLLSECLRALSFSRTAQALFPDMLCHLGVNRRPNAGGSRLDASPVGSDDGGDDGARGRSHDNPDGGDSPEKSGRRRVVGNDRNGNVEYGDDDDDVFRANGIGGRPPASADTPASRAARSRVPLSRPASLRLNFPSYGPGSSSNLSMGGMSTSSQSSAESLLCLSTSPDSPSAPKLADGRTRGRDAAAVTEPLKRSLSASGPGLNLSFDSASTFYRTEKAAAWPVTSEMRRRLLKSSQSLSPGPHEPTQSAIFYRNRCTAPPSSSCSVDSLHSDHPAADRPRPGASVAGERRHAWSAGALNSPERRRTPGQDGSMQGVVESLLSPLVNRSWFRTGSYTFKRMPSGDGRRGTVVPRRGEESPLFRGDCGILEAGAAGRSAGTRPLPSPSDSPRRGAARGFAPEGLFFSGQRSPDEGGGGGGGGDVGDGCSGGGGGGGGGRGCCARCQDGGLPACRGSPACAGCGQTWTDGPGDGAVESHDLERRA